MTSSDDAGFGETSQTTRGAMARRREQIGLCAAKCAGLTGVPAQRYARDVRLSLLLLPGQQASGTVLPLEKAIRLEFLRQLAPWLMAPVLCVALAFSIPDFWIQSLFVALILMTFGVPLRLAEVLSWRDKIRGAMSALPEARALIRVEPKQLTIGATSASWVDIRLEAIELQYLWRPRIFPKYRVNQLRLSTSNGPLVLDERLIKYGQEVVDAICVNLV